MVTAGKGISGRLGHGECGSRLGSCLGGLDRPAEETAFPTQGAGGGIPRNPSGWRGRLVISGAAKADRHLVQLFVGSSDFAMDETAASGAGQPPEPHAAGFWVPGSRGAKRLGEP